MYGRSKSPIYGPTATPKKPLGGTVTTPGQAYGASIQQTGEDYGNIMGGYQSVLNNSGNSNSPLSSGYQSIANNNKLGGEPEYNTLMSNYQGLLNQPGYQDYTPTNQVYEEDARTTGALSNLEGLSQSGGYSEGDLQNLRARATSPIRAIYQNAQRNLDRQRSLGGGYSPNYAAATTRMAREQSDLAGGALSNMNAGIAENVANNRVSLAPQLFAATNAINERKNLINQGNTAATNQAAEFNRTGRQNAIDSRTGALEGMGGLISNRTNAMNQLNTSRLQAMNSLQEYGQNNVDNQLQALGGMQGLYGTTPGLAQVFGNQDLQRQQLGLQGQNASNNFISSASQRR